MLPRNELDAAVLGLRQRLASAVERDLVRKRSRATELRSRLPTPSRRLQAAQQQVDDACERLGRATTIALARRQDRLHSARRALDVLGPLQSLRRGYGIALADDGAGAVIRAADDARPGDRIRVRLHRGALSCTVDEAHAGALDLRGRSRE